MMSRARSGRIVVALSVVVVAAACGGKKEEAPAGGGGMATAAPVEVATADAAEAAVAPDAGEAAAAAADADDAAEAAAAPDAGEAAEAAAAPTFTDPDSAAVYEEAQAVLAQLLERGPKHARYPEDCPGVWAAIEASPLAKEKDPAAVKVVEDVATFCLHDLALWLANNRLDVISVMEEALEKKVGTFQQDSWDRVCGFPIEQLAKAARRYPDDPQFTTLAKPIIKRCGKRPRG